MSELAAGRFSSWVIAMEKAQRDEEGVDVPCGACTACCTSSQFVHVGPDETEALARIPRALRFPAPGLPEGHVVLGYDEHGRCPMFVEGRCSIYEHRPRTCRTYDCRVFPAAGVELTDDDKMQITERARRWRFDLPSSADHIQHAAVQAAASYLRDHAGDLPSGAVPPNPTQLAFLAVKIHRLFLGPGHEGDEAVVVVPPPAVVEAAVLAPSEEATEYLRSAMSVVEEGPGG